MAKTGRHVRMTTVMEVVVVVVAWCHDDEPCCRGEAVVGNVPVSTSFTKLRSYQLHAAHMGTCFDS